MNCSIDRLEKRSQALQCLDYNRDIEVFFGEYAEGSLEFTPVDRRYANDPASALDVLGFALGHIEYDTTAEEIELIQTDNLDSRSQTANDIAGTQRIVELRQTHVSASHYISDSGAADEAWAQQFIAGGENIYVVRLKIYDLTGNPDPLETFDLEIWSDNGSDKPNAQLASTNTVTVNCTGGVDDATNDYIGALDQGTTYADAAWETIDMSDNTPNIMGSATLAIGTLYWLVIRNVADVDDDLGVCYTTTEYNENGLALQDDDVDNSPLWGDAPANTEDLTFILQFYTDDGLQLDFYDYATTTTGVRYTFKKVKCLNSSGLSVSPMQVAQGSLKWTSEDVVISTIE
jgi:hypothetical protein